MPGKVDASPLLSPPPDLIQETLTVVKISKEIVEMLHHQIINTAYELGQSAVSWFKGMNTNSITFC